MSAFQIFCTYVLRNKNAWYVSLVDVFVYMVRFGMISWLPIYLLTVKHFLKNKWASRFYFLNGLQSLPRYLPVGCQTNCLKGVVCHWRWFVWRWFSFAWLATGKVNRCLWWQFCCHCWLPDLRSTISGFRSDYGDRSQLCCWFCSRLTRFYELYLRCVSGHQPVWYYGRSYWLAWRILSSWLRYYLLHHFLLVITSWCNWTWTSQSRIYKRTLITFPRAVSLGSGVYYDL